MSTDGGNRFTEKLARKTAGAGGGGAKKNRTTELSSDYFYYVIQNVQTSGNAGREDTVFSLKNM